MADVSDCWTKAVTFYVKHVQFSTVIEIHPRVVTVAFAYYRIGKGIIKYLEKKFQ